MKDKKKINKFLRFCLFTLFAIYITLYVSNKYGYYEYKKYEQVTLTQEQILRFEEDIRNGIDISLDDYVLEKKDYDTNLTRAMDSVSMTISKSVSSAIKGVFSSLAEMIG